MAIASLIFEIFECTHLKFTVYGRKQASKQACMYVNTLPQCSPASVRLAQARPNKLTFFSQHLRILVQDQFLFSFSYLEVNFNTIVIVIFKHFSFSFSTDTKILAI